MPRCRMLGALCRRPRLAARFAVGGAILLALAVGMSRADDAPLLTSDGLKANGGKSPSGKAAGNPAALAAIFAKQVQPLVKQFCLDCHSGAKPDGKLDLAGFTDAAAVVAQRATWEKVAMRLRDEEMPPEDEKQPSPGQRRQLIEAIDHLLARGPAGRRDPGRVTLHRLNRNEYNNTIRDLLHVEFRPADDFPSDDVGYGFDNIGDVLSMPPTLVEKYLSAARKIAEQAIRVPGPPPIESHLAGKNLKGKKGSSNPTDDGGREMYSNGPAYGECQLPADGEYLVKIRAHEDHAGDEPAKMELRIDGKQIETFQVAAVAADPATYETRVRLYAGQHKISAIFINDYYVAKKEETPAQDRNLTVHHIDVHGPVEIEFANLPESHHRLIPRPITPENHDQEIHQSLWRFASRAFRRPVKPEEVERLKRLVKLAEEHGDSVEQGMRLALEAILVSPHFLYRVEADPPGSRPGSIRPLGEFELASRLSYFLWSSTPDPKLLEAANHGELHKPGNLDAQVQRMLADPKAQALVENFAGQWLELRMLKAFAPDPKQFPAFDETLRSAMIQETEQFFGSVLRDNRSVLDFIDSDYSFVNERLAKHYGLSGVKGAEFRRVSLPADQRGGLLGQASILALTSNPTRTSPVKRGRWVLENLLGTPPPPPPADVPPLEEKAATALKGTLRQRLEQHRSKADCAVCHNRMDPLGFGLENYDAIGAWRTRDAEAPIDASGILPGGRSFNGPRELKAILKARQTAFVSCLAEKLLTYALGRGLEYDDRGTIDDIVAATAKDGYRFQTLLLAVVHSEPFQKRKVPGGEP